jgi:hypothetical protein
VAVFDTPTLEDLRLKLNELHEAGVNLKKRWYVESDGTLTVEDFPHDLRGAWAVERTAAKDAERER